MSDDDGRFAVLRFELHVDDYPTEAQARRRLEKLEPFERLGLVDRETGLTRCRRDLMRVVMDKLEDAGTAPAGFSRTGAIGSYLRLAPRKAAGR